MVYHSKLTQVVAAICGIIIGCIVLSGLYAVSSLTLIYLGLIDSNLHSNAWLLIIVYGCFFYCCRVMYLFIRFFRTIAGKISFDSENVYFELGNKSQTFKWKDLTNSKAHADCQIFCLFDNDKRHIFSIWELANGYKEFRESFVVANGT